MAPNRARARNQQPQAPQPSDYETDAAPAALDVPLPPPRSNEELNLSVLRRVYPELLAIEHVTSFVALYVFNLENQAWEKVGVEGTMFICQLTPAPNGAERYCVVILNRKGLDNFYLELTSSEEMEISEPYIIVQGDQVYGLWIFADPPPATTANSLAETAEKIMKIADRAKTSREAKDREGKNGVKQAVEQTEAASSAPMGRQLSLRQLFGQQRDQDAGFKVDSHNSGPPPNMYAQQPAYMSPPNHGPAQQDVLVDDEGYYEGHELERNFIDKFLQERTEIRHETLETTWADMVKEGFVGRKASPIAEDFQISKSHFADGIKELQRRRAEKGPKKQFKVNRLSRGQDMGRYSGQRDMNRRRRAHGLLATHGTVEGFGPNKTSFSHHPSGTKSKKIERAMQHPANDSLEIEVSQDQTIQRAPQTATYWRYVVTTSDTYVATTPPSGSPSSDQAALPPAPSWWTKRRNIIKLDVLVLAVSVALKLYMLGSPQQTYLSLDGP